LAVVWAVSVIGCRPTLRAKVLRVDAERVEADGLEDGLPVHALAALAVR
jgi:hypothetical protein